MSSAAPRLSGAKIGFGRAPQQDSPGFQLLLDRVDLRPGDRLALVGPNGCGKTTALSILSLVLAPHSSEDFILEAAEPIGLRQPETGKTRSRVTNFRRRHMGIAQQSGCEIPFLSVRDRIDLRLRLASVGQREERLKETLERFDLGPLAGRKPEALSQGQRQRVGIATACSFEPAFIFADEPTATMDDHWSERVIGILSNIATQRKSCVVISTHDPDLALRHGFTLIEPRSERSDQGQQTVFTVSEMR